MMTNRFSTQSLSNLKWWQTDLVLSPSMVSTLILGLFIGCQYVPGSNLLSLGPPG